MLQHRQPQPQQQQREVDAVLLRWCGQSVKYTHLLLVLALSCGATQRGPEVLDLYNILYKLLRRTLISPLWFSGSFTK